MNKYRVEWWEEKKFKCEVTIEAENAKQAKIIAMEPYCDGSRELSAKEESSYSEELEEITESGLISIEEVGD